MRRCRQLLRPVAIEKRNGREDRRPSFLHCNYIGFPCHPHQVKASDIISCHLMSRGDFYHFTRILGENNYFHTVDDDDESVVPPHGSIAVADEPPELDGRCSAE
jgi:hypothetical protein